MHLCRISADRVIWLVIGCVLLVLGCGGPQRPRSSSSGWYLVQFEGAALSARRSTGGPWHTGATDGSSAIIGGLIGLAVGYPEAGFALGSALVSDPEFEAPAPFVIVKIAGDTYRISPIGQTLAPKWAQPIAIPYGRYTSETPALIQILDAVDEGLLGQKSITVGELLQTGPRTLTDIGDVSSLDIDVQRMPPRARVEIEMYVNARRSLNQLIETGDRDWAAIPVWNGDHVTIRAAGEVCPSSPTPCYGPEGAEAGRWRGYNYEEFADARHASLVGVLPGQALEVGSGLDFVAAESGLLLLFVNDTDEGNNEGGFEVRVVVEPGR